ncbi:MAG TPA: DUF885 domain-containing protein, partial [Caulobacter sp.]|nr:DUF885 domain-containing protein [Caulobacter sp.]
FVQGTLADVLSHYGYVDLELRPSPYVVSQMNGAYYWLPDFIAGQHPLDGPADVAAWHERLAGLAGVLDSETGRIGDDAARGIVPPRFVIDRTLAQIAALRDGSPGASPLIAPAAARAAQNGLGDILPSAELTFREVIAPALSRQIDALDALRSRAVDTAGVWRLPDGEAYYAAALRANTTVDDSPARLHEAGLAQVEDLLARIDQSLAAQGLTQGSVGARIRAMNSDVRFLATDDDAGRDRLLATARQALERVSARLPSAFLTTGVEPVIVERVPQTIEQGSPGAFYQEGAPGEPGVFRLNLSSVAEHPLWRLPTLAHHEGVPGHHFQAGVLRQAGALPLFRRMAVFSAYSEGWALYAQQVADELEVFEDDPFARIGYLQSQLFRAARIVVDTGLHFRRWERAQAVAWMVDRIGEPAESAGREIDRYCVYPGQACSFKVGANAIVAAREAARTRLGPAFDIRRFHERVLTSGPVPMAVLASMTAQWDGAA